LEKIIFFGGFRVGAHAKEQVMEDPKKIKLSGLLKNKNFFLVFFSTIFISISFSAYLVAEQWYVVNQLGLEASLGLVMMATILPRLFFMILGGVLTDRISATKVMAASTFLRGFVLIGMLVMFLTNYLNIEFLIFFALLFGILDALFWPANNSIIPTIVSAEHLTRANSIMRTAYQLSMMLGPMLAGYLIMYASYSTIFGVIAILLFISSLMLLFIKGSKPLNKKKDSVLGQIKEGFIYVKKSPSHLRFITLLIMTNLLFIGPVSIGTPIIVTNNLGGSSTSLASLSSAWAGGLVVGAIITGILNLKKNRGKLTVFLLISQGILMFLFGLIEELGFAIVVVLLMGLVTSMVNIPIYSFIQEITKKDLLGRVMSLFSIGSLGLVPLSYLIVSLLLSAGINIQYILWTSGLILSCYCILVFTFDKNLRSSN
jgi:MFS transporter, DHA3 family, macrolide efflux protein